MKKNLKFLILCSLLVGAIWALLPQKEIHTIAASLPQAELPASKNQDIAASPAAAGTVEFKSLDSTVLSQPANFAVYLPPSYASGKASYPVIIFLHGLFENEKRWADRGGKDLMDRLIAEKKVGEAVVAIPDGGRGFYTNSYDGTKKYEDFVVQEFIPYIEKNYRIKPGPKWCALSGSSMGGYGALKIGMRHAAMFNSVSAHSAVLIDKFPETIEPGTRQARYLQILEGPFGKPFHREFWESENPIRLAERPEKFSGLRLYFDCGNHDRYSFDEGARLLHQVLESKGFAHEFAILPGDHGWEYLKEHMHRSLEFHWKYLGK